MNSMKKLSAVLAGCMALTIFAAGCGKSTEDDELVPNVITSAEGGSSEVAAEGSTAPVETEVVTDAEGSAMTGVNGDVLTQPVTQETQVPADTLSQEQLEALLSSATETKAPQVESPVASSERYGYSTLDDDEKALYDAIVGAASTMNFRIRGTEDVSLEKWAKVLGLVYNQEPQLFWLNSKVKVGRIYFNDADVDKINAMQAEIDATVNKLLAEADKVSSTYDKLKIFHDYLVLNSSFELKDDVSGYNDSIYNAFGHGDGEQGNIQCGGYARAMQYLCDKAGIECMVITGNRADGSTHAWNKVKVNGEWYNLDTTWDDPLFPEPMYNYIRYNFFLVPDEWINEKSHLNINTRQLGSDGTRIKYFDPPAATATAENYFVKNGLVFNDFDSADAAMKKALDDAANSGGHVAHIMAGSKEVYDKLLDARSSYKKYVMGGHSNVTNLTSNCSDDMLLIQLDLKY